MTKADQELVQTIIQNGYNYRSRLWVFNTLLDYRLFSKPSTTLIKHRKK